MAMMASGSSGNPYDQFGNGMIEQDLIDPDDATIDDLDDPLQSDRTPLTGNIQSSSRHDTSQSYLNSAIQGEDRRAPINTIDESVWDTLSRDLRASWEKLRLVLWPKYLLGGLLQREGGLGGLERGEGGSLAGGLRGIAGRIPDADMLLEGGMSEGLRDWDLWYISLFVTSREMSLIDLELTSLLRGPLVFSLLLSLLLSSTAAEKDVAFSGVFALVWIGSVVVTFQIRLLGGKM
ncbi:hypothetical protein MMC17_001453 [Xylographa soralifera]|nr:hypothetical protein [Xylographa soralifera]